MSGSPERMDRPNPLTDLVAMQREIEEARMQARSPERIRVTRKILEGSCIVWPYFEDLDEALLAKLPAWQQRKMRADHAELRARPSKWPLELQIHPADWARVVATLPDEVKPRSVTSPSFAVSGLLGLPVTYDDDCKPPPK